MAPCPQTTRSLLLANSIAAQREDCHLEKPDASLLRLRRSFRLVRDAQCRERLRGIARAQRRREQGPANPISVREHPPAAFRKFGMLAGPPRLEPYLLPGAGLPRLSPGREGLREQSTGDEIDAEFLRALFPPPDAPGTRRKILDVSESLQVLLPRDHSRGNAAS